MWRWGKRLKISHGADELPLTRAAVRFYSLTPDAMDEQEFILTGGQPGVSCPATFSLSPRAKN